MADFIDIHCHILPGLDDGAKNWEETLAMARQAVDDGIRLVIATPHQSEQYPTNTAHRIVELVFEARRRFEHERLPLEILPGADIRVNEEVVTKISRGELVTLGNHCKHILLELPSDAVLPLCDLVFDLELRGIRSILSHPERNTALQEDISSLEQLVTQGCLLQVTAGSFLGTFGRAARRTALRLLRAGMVHLVASDAHDTQHRPFVMSPAYNFLAGEIGPAAAEKICRTNSTLVSNGVEFDPPLPTF